MNIVALILVIAHFGTSINIRGKPQVSDQFKSFWTHVVEPVIPAMVQLNLKGPTTLPSCDSVSAGAFNTQCWFDRYNWISSQSGMTDLINLATKVATAATFLNQSTAISESIELPQFDSSTLPNAIALALGDLDSATNPAVSTVSANVQNALTTANSLSTSLGQSFNSTIATLWNLVSFVLGQSGQVDATNINSLIASGNAQNALSSSLSPLTILTQLNTVTAPNAINSHTTSVLKLINSIDLVADTFPSLISAGNVNVTNNVSRIQTNLNRAITNLASSLTNTMTLTYNNSLRTMIPRLNTTNSSILTTINSWSNSTNNTISQMWKGSQSQLKNISVSFDAINSSMVAKYNQVVTTGSGVSTSSSTDTRTRYTQLQTNASAAGSLAQNLTTNVVNLFSGNATTTIGNLNSALSAAETAIRNSVANGANNSTGLGSTLTKSFSEIATIQKQITNKTMEANQASIDAFLNLTQQSSAMGTLFNQLTANLYQTQSALKSGVSNNASNGLMGSLDQLTRTISSIQSQLDRVGIDAANAASSATNTLNTLSTNTIPQTIESFNTHSSLNMSNAVEKMVQSIMDTISTPISDAENNIVAFKKNMTDSGSSNTDTYNRYQDSIRVTSSDSLSNGRASAISTIAATSEGLGNLPATLVYSIQSYSDSLQSALNSLSSKALEPVRSTITDLSTMTTKLNSQLGTTQADYSQNLFNSHNQATTFVNEIENLVDQFVASSLSFRQYNVSAQEDALSNDFNTIEEQQLESPANTAGDKLKNSLSAMASTMIASNQSLDAKASDATLAGFTDRVNAQTGILAANKVWINSFKKLWDMVSQTFKAPDGSTDMMGNFRSITKLFVTAKAIDDIVSKSQSKLADIVDSQAAIQNKTIFEIADQVTKLVSQSFLDDLEQPSTKELEENMAIFKSDIAKLLSLNPSGTFTSSLAASLPSTVESYSKSLDDASTKFSDEYEESAETIKTTLNKLAKDFAAIAVNASKLSDNPNLVNLQNLLSRLGDAIDTNSTSAFAEITNAAREAVSAIEKESVEEQASADQVSTATKKLDSETDQALALGNQLSDNLMEMTAANKQTRENSISSTINRLKESNTLMTNSVEKAISGAIGTSQDVTGLSTNSQALRALLENQMTAFTTFISTYQDQLAEQVANNNQSLGLSLIDIQRRIRSIGESIATADTQLKSVVGSISQEIDSRDDSFNQVRDLSKEIESVWKDFDLTDTLDVSPITAINVDDATQSDAASTISSAITDVNDLISQVSR